MRIASVNLLHGLDVRQMSHRQSPATAHVDLEAAAVWIDSLGADVVALQEVDTGLRRSRGVDQVSWLADRLGCAGAFAAALMGDPDGRWDEVPRDGLPDGAAGYGVGLLSRTALGDVERIPLPHGGPGRRQPGASPTRPGVDREPRVVLSATVGDPTGIRVSTTHLSYMFWRAIPQLGRAMAVAADHHTGPGVLIGDVNLPRWGGWLALHARGLAWAWPHHATRAHGWRHVRGRATYPSWSPRVQLDQAFVRDVAGPIAVTVGPPGPSDHLPLLVDL